MKTQLAIIGLVMALVAGCQTSSKQMNYIRLGMEEKEVIKFLGTPASRIENRDGTVTLHFTLLEASPMWAGNIGTMNGHYSIRMVNGKVDSYGRECR